LKDKDKYKEKDLKEKDKFKDKDKGKYDKEKDKHKDKDKHKEKHDKDKDKAKDKDMKDKHKEKEFKDKVLKDKDMKVKDKNKKEKMEKIFKEDNKGKGTGAARNRSKRAGLVFPVGRVARELKALVPVKSRVQSTASVYLAAIMEYVMAELLEVAGNQARNSGKKRINPRHIMLAIKGDEELNELIRATISEAGVQPDPRVGQMLLVLTLKVLILLLKTLSPSIKFSCCKSI